MSTKRIAGGSQNGADEDVLIQEEGEIQDRDEPRASTSKFSLKSRVNREVFERYELGKPIYVQKRSAYVMLVHIDGTSPYMQQKFSEKSKEAMKKKQSGEAVDSVKKVPRNPKEEFEASTHKISKNRFGIPVMQFKKAMVMARPQNMTELDAKRGLYVLGDFTDMDDPSVDLVEIKGPRTMHNGTVRIGGFSNKVANPRYRPIWYKWSCKIRVKFYPFMGITAQKVLQMVADAGQFGGIGEMRASKTGAGFGAWEVRQGIPIKFISDENKKG